MDRSCSVERNPFKTNSRRWSVMATRGNRSTANMVNVVDGTDDSASAGGGGGGDNGCTHGTTGNPHLETMESTCSEPWHFAAEQQEELNNMHNTRGEEAPKDELVAMNDLNDSSGDLGGMDWWRRVKE